VPAAALRFKPDATVLAQYGGSPLPAAAGKSVWVLSAGAIAPVAVKAGPSDGTYTEVSGTTLTEGAQLVTRATAASTSTSSSAARPAAGNPLMPTGRGGPRM